jgi:hypothetical protein
MAIPLKTLLETLDGLPFVPPPGESETLAVINDALRDLKLQPLSTMDWADAPVELDRTRARILEFLAFVIQATPLGRTLRAQTVAAGNGGVRLGRFLEDLREVPIETLSKSAFRREELLRKFCKAFALPIEGETPEKSESRLQAVDFNRLKRAMEREEQERKRIAAEWAEKLAAKAAAEAAARASQPQDYE